MALYYPNLCRDDGNTKRGINVSLHLDNTLWFSQYYLLMIAFDCHNSYVGRWGFNAHFIKKL